MEWSAANDAMAGELLKVGGKAGLSLKMGFYNLKEHVKQATEPIIQSKDKSFVPFLIFLEAIWRS
jgi:hypothetical protein